MVNFDSVSDALKKVVPGLNSNNEVRDDDEARQLHQRGGEEDKDEDEEEDEEEDEDEANDDDD